VHRVDGMLRKGGREHNGDIEAISG
jgi:hypothetical protein